MYCPCDYVWEYYLVYIMLGTLSPDISRTILVILFYTIMAGHIFQMRYCPVNSGMDTF